MSLFTVFQFNRRGRKSRQQGPKNILQATLEFLSDQKNWMRGTLVSGRSDTALERYENEEPVRACFMGAIYLTSGDYGANREDTRRAIKIAQDCGRQVCGRSDLTAINDVLGYSAVIRTLECAVGEAQ